MSWTKIKNFIIISSISLVILFILESVSSIAFYQIKKPNTYFFSSTVETLKRLTEGKLKQTDSSLLKLEVINAERAKGVEAYPSYLFEPQLQHPSDFVYLSDVANKTIIDCNENGFFSRWQSDAYGFRNPTTQSSVYSDVLLVGDSFTSGACENEAGTIAGFLRSNGMKVANLAIGGSGPIHQLATIVEYGDTYRAKEVIWIVFTGNDLFDLRHEKTTSLNRYLDPYFTQNLATKHLTVSNSLQIFLNDEISNNNLRVAKNINLQKCFYCSLSQSFSLDAIDAGKKEKKLLIEVASRIKQETDKRGANLKIVLLSHPDPNFWPNIQDVVADTLIDFAIEHELDYLKFSRNFLSNKSDPFYLSGPHFSAKGYRTIGSYLYEWLLSSTNKIL